MNISIFSTYALDKIIDKDGHLISEQLGGPMFYLKRALEDIDLGFDFFHGETVDVEIKISDKGEIGRIVSFPKIIPLPMSISKWIIVSTIFNEWDLRTVPKLNGKIFVDIQGYIRHGNNFGGKTIWKDIRYYADNIYCLKGTKEEMSYLPKSVYEDQKKRLLIITDGERGVEWFSRGQRYSAMIERNVKSLHTIGVGDTFFGYFVGFLYKRKTLESSMRLAIKNTEKFLFSNKKI